MRAKKRRTVRSARRPSPFVCSDALTSGRVPRKVVSQQGKMVLGAEVVAEALADEGDVLPDELLREHRMVREQLEAHHAVVALAPELTPGCGFVAEAEGTQQGPQGRGSL